MKLLGSNQNSKSPEVGSVMRGCSSILSYHHILHALSGINALVLGSLSLARVLLLVINDNEVNKNSFPSQ